MHMCLGDPRAELWEGAVKSLSLQSESPLSPRPFPLTIGISWEDDLALFLVFVYFYLGESRPHRLLLPFLLYHHPLPVLSLHRLQGLAVCFLSGGRLGTAQTDSEAASEQKDHSPYALAASFGQCILHIRPRADPPGLFSLPIIPAALHCAWPREKSKACKGARNGA